MAQIINLPEFQRMDVDQRRNQLQQIVSQSRADARAELNVSNRRPRPGEPPQWATEDGVPLTPAEIAHRPAAIAKYYAGDTLTPQEERIVFARTSDEWSAWNRRRNEQLYEFKQAVPAR